MRRNKKNNLILLFVVLMLIIGVGYAYLNSNLSINGTANISSSSWNVYWSTLQVQDGSVTDVTIPARIKSGNTEVEFNVNLNEPGDFYEFTVNAVNDGSIDAMIGDLTTGVYAANGTTPKPLPAYLEYTITYGDGIALEENHILSAGTTETYRVKVKYKEDINASQLPSTDDHYVFKCGVSYAQKGNSGVERMRKITIYRNSTVKARIGDSIVPREEEGYCFKSYYNGEVAYNSCSYNLPYSSESDCLNQIYNENDSCEPIIYQTNGIGEYTTNASELNKTYYLKHEVIDNIITASYVCFIFENKEYCMQGGNTSYESANRALLISLQEKFYLCGDNGPDEYRCSAEGFSIITSEPSIWVNINMGGGNGCSIYDYDSTSQCYVQ